MARDRKQTRGEILNAVGRLLARSGFREVGVNSVAREAGVDKVLIYRYFGGLPELLKAFAEETDFWPDLPELASDTNQPPVGTIEVGTTEVGTTEVGTTEVGTTEAERAKLLVLAFGRALRRRPLTQEIMRWELLERNELTDALARHREEQGSELFRHLEESGDVDIRAIGSLLAAGQTYLILRSKTADLYNGLNLNSEEDWSRIERAAGFLVDAAFAKRDATKIKPPVEKRRTTRRK